MYVRIYIHVYSYQFELKWMQYSEGVWIFSEASDLWHRPVCLLGGAAPVPHWVSDDFIFLLFLLLCASKKQYYLLQCWYIIITIIIIVITTMIIIIIMIINKHFFAQ